MNRGFKDDWLEKLKSSNDIVTTIGKYITLSRRGKTWWACCPFHFEKTASFAVNEQEQYYHCFGCGASGDVINFVEKFESLDFYDACKKLAEYAGMELPEYQNDENVVKLKKKRERIYQVLLDTAKFYYSNLKKPEAKPALEYLAKRKLDLPTIKEFGLGYSIDFQGLVEHLKGIGYNDTEMLDAGVVDIKNGKLSDALGKRLVFPIFNLYGNVVGFSARVLEKTDFAKYKNTAQTLVFDKSNCIYGISQIKKLKTTEKISEIVIVEGQMDVISLHKCGVKNAVACMGTALTMSHAKNLKRFTDKVILSFDGDSAGKKATLRSIEMLVASGLNVYVITIPNGNDPDEFVNMYGKEKWDELLSGAKYWVDFLIDDMASGYDLSRKEQVSKFTAQALALIKTLPTQTEQELYLKQVQNLSGVTMSVLKSDLSTAEEKPSSVVTATVSPQAKPETLRENAYAKAVKFVLSALLYKKPYAENFDNIRENLQNSDYIKIFDYVVGEKRDGRTPIVSKLFDMFDVENNRDIYDIVNYEFSPEQDNEKYYNDCVNLLNRTGKQKEQEQLLKQIASTTDPEEKNRLTKELGKIILNKKNTTKF